MRENPVSASRRFFFLFSSSSCPFFLIILRSSWLTSRAKKKKEKIRFVLASQKLLHTLDWIMHVSRFFRIRLVRAGKGLLYSMKVRDWTIVETSPLMECQKLVSLDVNVKRMEMTIAPWRETALSCSALDSISKSMSMSLQNPQDGHSEQYRVSATTTPG